MRVVLVVWCCMEGIAGWRYSVLVHRVPPVGPRLREIRPSAENRFKELRAARGLSVRQLAEKASVSTETVYSLEHGRRDFIWPKTARKLADALEVDPAELIED